MSRSQAITTPRQNLPGAALASSLWLRVGFFSGASLAVIGLRELVGAEAFSMNALVSIAVGAALTIISLRRSRALLEDAEASPQAGEPAAYVRRSLQNS